MNISGKPSMLAVHVSPVAVVMPPGTGLPPDFAPHDMTGPSTPSPFVISQSSQFDPSSLAAFQAFSIYNSSTSYWIGTGAGIDWLQVDLGSGKAYILGRYDVQVNSVPEPNRAPKNWTMQGSNNGTTWDTLDTQTNQTSWTSGQTRSYTPSVQTTAYRYFRLNITANNGDATYTQVGELYLFYPIPGGQTQFAPHNLTANVQSGYTASASSEDFLGEAYRAFNGTIRSSNAWRGLNAGVDWLKLDAGASASWLLDSYAVQMSTTVAGNAAPKNWTMEGSNNNSTWIVLDTVTNQTGWVFNEARTFTCDVKSVSYRYFRINVTANNGDPTYTVIAELFLYGT